MISSGKVLFMKENKNMELKEFEYFPWNTKKKLEDEH